MPRPLSIEYCEKIEAEFPELCAFSREHPQEARDALAQSKSHTERLPIGESRAAYEYFRQVSFGISPLCRQKAREAQTTANARSPAAQARLDEIESRPDYMKRNAPGRKKLMKERWDIRMGRWQGDSQTNGNGDGDAE